MYVWSNGIPVHTLRHAWPTEGASLTLPLLLDLDSPFTTSPELCHWTVLELVMLFLTFGLCTCCFFFIIQCHHLPVPLPRALCLPLICPYHSFMRKDFLSPLNIWGQGDAKAVRDLHQVIRLGSGKVKSWISKVWLRASALNYLPRLVISHSLDNFSYGTSLGHNFNIDSSWHSLLMPLGYDRILLLAVAKFLPRCYDFLLSTASTREWMEWRLFSVVTFLPSILPSIACIQRIVVD